MLFISTDCPEVFTLGIHWERTLTKTINTHKCSEIYPSSLKLTDVITRECLRNRTWAPVNMSQCVMNSDSPIIMIAVVTLETNSTSLVKSRQDIIIEEVRCLLYTYLFIQVHSYIHIYKHMHIHCLSVYLSVYQLPMTIITNGGMWCDVDPE